MTDSNTVAEKRLTALTAAAIALGAIWRWYMVYVAFRPSEHLFSDTAAYHDVAQRILTPGRALTVLDLIQPAGTGFLLAASLLPTKSLAVADALWFVLSAVTPIFWYFAARDLFGKKIGAAVGVWTALHFTGITFVSLFMSETPFIFLVAAGWMCLAKAMTGDGAGPWKSRWAVAIVGN